MALAACSMGVENLYLRTRLGVYRLDDEGIRNIRLVREVNSNWAKRGGSYSPTDTAQMYRRVFVNLCSHGRRGEFISPRVTEKKKTRSPSSSRGKHRPPSPIRPQATATAAAGRPKEVLPPSLDSTSEPPALFDGTPRLYISYICPYAQRAWIARNYKGLQDKIQLVPINLENRPAWYKERVYPANKVPSLEHNNQVRGESLDLVKYIDSEFEGPKLLPEDPEKKTFAEELLSFCDTFNGANYKAFTSKGDVELEYEDAYDRLEIALGKYGDRPFFLGQFSEVDIAYAPFIERFHPFFLQVKNYDVTKGRPRLAQWIQELEYLDPYTQTKRDPQELLEVLKRRFGIK